MAFLGSLRRVILGEKLDPLNPATRHHIVLVAFLAWIGLGADGLSSSCYGPEQAFLALGPHMPIGLWLAVATAVTVFIIAMAYNQIIELFPAGGGGYRAATRLIGPYAGLVSGAALIVDYFLTIAVSIASGADAVFSVLGPHAQDYKFPSEIIATILLLLLNLRGVKESIKFLLPVFLGFFLTHIALIVAGIAQKADSVTLLLPNSIADTRQLAGSTSWLFVASLFLRAYSLGGGTYTGIEAVSNNINILKEPRIRTGHWTMFYMAASLAFTAGGIILLYLLWQVHPVDGQTLNAVVFRSILTQLHVAPATSNVYLAIVLALEGGLLFVAANTGFLGAPAVMANMAADRWVPRQFRQLSSRMVTQNGVLVMGLAALAILIGSHGNVAVLVVLYSINVFLTFSLSLFGLCKHWWRSRRTARHWVRHLAVAIVGLSVTASILVVTIAEKFTEGGWITLLVTSGVVGACLMIRRHYDRTNRALARVDDSYSVRMNWDESAELAPRDRSLGTAVFFMGGNRGAGMYALQWVLRMFPDRFTNFVFAAVGEIDKQNFDADGALQTLCLKVENSLHYFRSYCASRGLPSASYHAFGSDPLEELMSMSEQIFKDYPNAIFFASKLIVDEDDFMSRILHNQLPFAIMRYVHNHGRELIIIPVPLPRADEKPRDARHIR